MFKEEKMFKAIHAIISPYRNHSAQHCILLNQHHSCIRFITGFVFASILALTAPTVWAGTLVYDESVNGDLSDTAPFTTFVLVASNDYYGDPVSGLYLQGEAWEGPVCYVLDTPGVCSEIDNQYDYDEFDVVVPFGTELGDVYSLEAHQFIFPDPDNPLMVELIVTDNETGLQVYPSFTNRLPAGTYHVRYGVQGGGLLKPGTESYELLVEAWDLEPGTFNYPPVANAGPDQETNIPGTVVQLDGSASSDTDGSIVTWSWALSVPTGSAAVLSDPAVVNPTFTVDVYGDYIATLTVTDDAGDSSTDSMTVVHQNFAPVADAGPDQAVTEAGTLVQLDGTASYDDDGIITGASWTLSVPPASASVLSDSSSLTPTFIADIYGDYIATLVVTDDAGDSSVPDSMLVSFDNIAPVADAGLNQVVDLGAVVILDGSSSSDANNDNLYYNWTLTNQPATSSAMLVDADTVSPSFVADEAGNYSISLVVNDGLLDSIADIVQVQATDSPGLVIQKLVQLVDTINAMDDAYFKHVRKKNYLTGEINDAIAEIEAGRRDHAIRTLDHMLMRVDGCANDGTADNNDQILDCVAQGSVYPVLVDCIERLNALQ